jgi:hypothetical protein
VIVLDPGHMKLKAIAIKAFQKTFLHVFLLKQVGLWIQTTVLKKTNSN